MVEGVGEWRSVDSGGGWRLEEGGAFLVDKLRNGEVLRNGCEDM